ncbi:NAD(FAD)-utilizing dehydrogenases [Bathymodiolus thermophilus thioautotrophic gill symbiont]|uniref:NAD(P)/FAD-dependent oxidoreductase n=1 Tax=Bathymodiolus thermophilus thioautotrophic gill symbiont TaxID=2360 RepID=UPI0010BC8024|nr:NAD(P)/FAD-dependent oxidoreductase [Bathymodiolus thermophilus thioautotrophic gill symbiont]SGZ79198.1 NAD(FAD)-utilizing dehydrogenases [Bathymodiolus thermophilus thioautotrophic gill symbiont]
MKYDVIIIGAGAAGLMCAAQARCRGRKVLLIDKANKVGKKILISGGGRCNFTNLHIDSSAYISSNPHFCKSALSRYNQWDFLAFLEKSGLHWQEKTLGQLFCDEKSGAVLNMLLDACQSVTIQRNVNVEHIAYQQHYMLTTNQGKFQASSLVIATGGASIPKMGATDFGLQVAKQFGLKSINFRPALVPFTFHQDDINCYFKDLSGLSIDAIVQCNNQSFREGVLITHRGISGPAVLQISSYWQKGDAITLNLLPDLVASDWLLQMRDKQPKSALKTLLSTYFPKRLAVRLADTLTHKNLSDKALNQIKKDDLITLGATLNHWILTPNGTEGMRTAEVCVGGVSTSELSSKTMQANKQQGLYFIGETVDVTGWLGGYNFQWAWSSGWVAGQYV